MSPRILLFPFSVLYGLIIGIRNLLFNNGIIQSRSFPFPVITVGNLSTGGTGKTPHVAYLANLLKGQFKIATLSRGYGRNTKGFFIADEQSDAKQIGDEPMLYHHRFANAVLVGVGENRVKAIEQIKQLHPQMQAIILDDAYQHRYVKAGLNILLTEFNHPYFNDYLLPAGNLRESRRGMKRADIIVVTKCPDNLNEQTQKDYTKKINPFPRQQIFFSGFKYGNYISLKSDLSLTNVDLKDYDVLLVSGIANPEHIHQYLKSVCANVFLLRFGDHHEYNVDDLLFIEKKFNTIASAKKIIITTEKDAMRLRDVSLSNMINQLPFYCLPIEVYFFNEPENFHQTIINYVTKN